MRIVATADFHGSLPQIPYCDLLLIAGDVCPDFLGSGHGKGQLEQSKWLERVFAPWLEEVPAEKIIGIAGNHDFVFESPHLVPRLPWTYLQDELTEYEGLRVYGIPWVPNLPFWAFHARDEALKSAYAAVEPCDILLTHGPPYGYGDFCGEHVGSVWCHDAIMSADPDWVVCGHIHEAYGYHDHVSSGANILNVAYNDGDYNPVNPPMVIELP